MVKKIKDNVKKISVLTGATLIGITGLIKVISDEAQEWISIMKKAEPQRIEREVNINRMEVSRNALLDSLNKIDKILIATNAK